MHHLRGVLANRNHLDYRWSVDRWESIVKCCHCKGSIRKYGNALPLLGRRSCVQPWVISRLIGEYPFPLRWDSSLATVSVWWDVIIHGNQNNAICRVLLQEKEPLELLGYVTICMGFSAAQYCLYKVPCGLDYYPIFLTWSLLNYSSH